MRVARQRPAQPREQYDDVEPEPHARDDLGGNARAELARDDAKRDPLAKSPEERAIDRVADARGGGTRKHQLAHEDARELGLRRVEREERTEEVLGLTRDRRALGQRRERAFDRAAEPVFEDERDQVFLRARVQKDRALGHAGALGHRRRRRRLEAALDEERRRGVTDSRALVFLVGLATHDY